MKFIAARRLFIILGIAVACRICVYMATTSKTLSNDHPSVNIQHGTRRFTKTAEYNCSCNFNRTRVLQYLRNLQAVLKDKADMQSLAEKVNKITYMIQFGEESNDDKGSSEVEVRTDKHQILAKTTMENYLMEATKDKKQLQESARPKRQLVVPTYTEQQLLETTTTKHLLEATTTKQNYLAATTTNQQLLKSTTIKQFPATTTTKQGLPVTTSINQPVLKSTTMKQKFPEATTTKQHPLAATSTKQELLKLTTMEQKLPEATTTKQHLQEATTTKQQLLKSTTTKQQLPDTTTTKQSLLATTITTRQLFEATTTKQQLPEATTTKQQQLETNPTKKESLAATTTTKQQLPEATTTTQQLLETNPTKKESLAATTTTKQQLPEATTTTQQLLETNPTKKESLAATTTTKQQLLEATTTKHELLKTNPTKKEPLEEATNKTQLLEVCPDIWKNKIDYPYWFKGWLMENCSNALPFHDILSILLYPQEDNSTSCSSLVNTIVSDLKESYGQVPLLVANVKNFCQDVNFTSQVRIVTLNDTNPQPGEVWNTLVNWATTRYVLIGRDIESFMWMPNLHRPVRVISYENNTIQIVGGAVRNQSGHWRIGCYQSSIKNYVLEYQEGYRKSKNECMFCDALAGPFVARTDLIAKIRFDDTLPQENLFEDFFLQVKRASYSVMNCPDLMYFASDLSLEKKSSDRSMWMPLAKKWGLNRIIPPSGRVFAYSCAESGLSCTNLFSHTYSYLIPICCLEQFGSAVGFLNEFCRSQKLSYEFEAGSVLGIVKVSGLMPWDLDGDFTYAHYNLSVYKENEKEFNKRGFQLDSFTLERNVSYFVLRTPDLYIEMIGELELSFDDPRATIFRENPTQALMHGHWVFTSPSPGLYSRNRYGVEMLRHTHSWLQLGMEGGAPYTSGYFKKCENPHHHACLDHFSVDGNLQFRVPN